MYNRSFAWEQPLPFIGEPPRVLRIVHVHGEPYWRYPYHAHPDRLELIYLESGRMTCMVDRIPLYAKEGDLIVFEPDVLHSTESDPDHPMNQWSCAFTGLQLAGLGKNRLLPKGAYPLASTGEDGQVICRIMKSIREQHERYGTTAVSRMLVGALSVLAAQIFSCAPTSPGGAKESFAPEVLRFINEHFQEPMSMQRIAENFHISASHIAHEVQRVYNVSPINYLIDRRISEAKWLLIVTEEPFSAIAARVGYENTEHFANLFLKRVGMNPTEFRRQRKQEGKLQ